MCRSESSRRIFSSGWRSDLTDDVISSHRSPKSFCATSLSEYLLLFISSQRHLQSSKWRQRTDVSEVLQIQGRVQLSALMSHQPVCRKLQFQPLPADVPVLFRVVELPLKHHLCKVKSLNKGDANSEVTVYYQVKNKKHNTTELLIPALSNRGHSQARPEWTKL